MGNKKKIEGAKETLGNTKRWDFKELVFLRDFRPDI